MHKTTSPKQRFRPCVPSALPVKAESRQPLYSSHGQCSLCRCRSFSPGAGHATLGTRGRTRPHVGDGSPSCGPRPGCQPNWKVHRTKSLQTPTEQQHKPQHKGSRASRKADVRHCGCTARVACPARETEKREQLENQGQGTAMSLSYVGVPVKASPDRRARARARALSDVLTRYIIP